MKHYLEVRLANVFNSTFQVSFSRCAVGSVNSSTSTAFRFLAFFRLGVTDVIGNTRFESQLKSPVLLSLRLAVDV